MTSPILATIMVLLSVTIAEADWKTTPCKTFVKGTFTGGVKDVGSCKLACEKAEGLTNGYSFESNISNGVTSISCTCITGNGGTQGICSEKAGKKTGSSMEDMKWKTTPCKTFSKGTFTGGVKDGDSCKLACEKAEGLTNGHSFESNISNGVTSISCTCRTGNGGTRGICSEKAGGETSSTTEDLKWKTTPCKTFAKGTFTGGVKDEDSCKLACEKAEGLTNGHSFESNISNGVTSVSCTCPTGNGGTRGICSEKAGEKTGSSMEDLKWKTTPCKTFAKGTFTGGVKDEDSCKWACEKAEGLTIGHTFQSMTSNGGVTSISCTCPTGNGGTRGICSESSSFRQSLSLSVAFVCSFLFVVVLYSI